MIKKKLSNAVILGSADLNNGVNSVENNKLNQTQDRIELDHKLDYNQITNCILEAPNGVATYSGTTITVKQGLKGLSASGNNPDGTINNVSASIDNDISVDISTYGNTRHKLMIFANKGKNNWSVGGRALSSQWFEQETQPEGTDWTWYNTKTREWKTSNDGVITDVNVIPLGIFNKTNSDITEFYTDQPVELVKRSDAQIQAPYITETYKNGTSWYRVWSDNFCEQGGILTYTQTKRFQQEDVVLLKPLKTVVSKLACSIDQVGSNSSGVSTVITNVDQDITSTSDQLNKIRICVERLYDSTASTNDKVYWEVKGFIN